MPPTFNPLPSDIRMALEQNSKLFNNFTSLTETTLETLLPAFLKTQGRFNASLQFNTAREPRYTRHCTAGDREFPVSAARVWNGLPTHVTSSPSLHDFKRQFEDSPLLQEFPQCRITIN